MRAFFVSGRCMNMKMNMKIDVALVRRLLAAQLPRWADLEIVPVEPGGHDHRTFRVGAGLSIRLPSAEAYAAQIEKERHWLPRLAPQLPLPIPEPVAPGTPGEGYPWPWSVYRWLEGETATDRRVDDMPRFARELARFLLALQQIDSSRGPVPGPHNFFRGGSLTTYDEQTREAIAALQGQIDAQAATELWQAALSAKWSSAPVWVHGDIAAGNLLVNQGQLSAVIDFGCAGVGDPACDLVIAWTFFTGESRAAFRDTLALEDGLWARARGWALWKALITLADSSPPDAARAPEATHASATLEAVLAEHAGAH